MVFFVGLICGGGGGGGGCGTYSRKVFFYISADRRGTYSRIGEEGANSKINGMWSSISIDFYNYFLIFCLVLVFTQTIYLQCFNTFLKTSMVVQNTPLCSKMWLKKTVSRIWTYSLQALEEKNNNQVKYNANPCTQNGNPNLWYV